MPLLVNNKDSQRKKKDETAPVKKGFRKIYRIPTCVYVFRLRALYFYFHDVPYLSQSEDAGIEFNGVLKPWNR